MFIRAMFLTGSLSEFSAYTDNEFDVAALMEEAESKAVALERVADLEDELGRVNERLQELEVKCSVLAAPLVSLMPTLPMLSLMLLLY